MGEEGVPPNPLTFKIPENAQLLQPVRGRLSICDMYLTPNPPIIKCCPFTSLLGSPFDPSVVMKLSKNKIAGNVAQQKPLHHGRGFNIDDQYAELLALQKERAMLQRRTRLPANKDKEKVVSNTSKKLDWIVLNRRSKRVSVRLQDSEQINFKIGGNGNVSIVKLTDKVLAKVTEVPKPAKLNGLFNATYVQHNENYWNNHTCDEANPAKAIIIPAERRKITDKQINVPKPAPTDKQNDKVSTTKTTQSVDKPTSSSKKKPVKVSPLINRKSKESPGEPPLIAYRQKNTPDKKTAAASSGSRRAARSVSSSPLSSTPSPSPTKRKSEAPLISSESGTEDDDTPLIHRAAAVKIAKINTDEANMVFGMKKLSVCHPTPKKVIVIPAPEVDPELKKKEDKVPLPFPAPTGKIPKKSWARPESVKKRVASLETLVERKKEISNMSMPPPDETVQNKTVEVEPASEFVTNDSSSADKSSVFSSISESEKSLHELNLCDDDDNADVLDLAAGDISDLFKGLD